MCEVIKEVRMPSNLDFDQDLLLEAKKLSGLKFKKDVVNLALKEYIKRHKKTEIIKLFHQVPYFEDYDYKEGRRKR
jgi:Arc/MetJ family transcription regulator